MAPVAMSRDSLSMRLKAFNTFKFQKAHKIIIFFPFDIEGT